MQPRGTLQPAPDSILFIRLWGLGDVLLSTPGLHAARIAYPNARITYVTAAAGADALHDNPDIDELIVVRRGLRPMLRALIDVRRRRADTVVDLHSTARTAYLVAVCGARRRVGFHGRGPRRALYTHVTPRRNPGAYAALELLRLLELIGVEAGPDPDLRLRITRSAEERAWAADVWHRHALEGATVVAASPVSMLPFKQWGAARWAAVADRLTERGARVLLTHGPRERAQAAAVVAHMKHAPVWDIDVRSVRQLAALYERCALWIGNDGGGKHVAVAAGVPTVTVSRYTMGATWTDTRPGQRHYFIDRPPPHGCDFRCSSCAHLGCLNAVAVEDVDDLVRAALADG
jgi:ADP-heptose:LPS heptosyltransferase